MPLLTPSKLIRMQHRTLSSAEQHRLPAMHLADWMTWCDSSSSFTADRVRPLSLVLPPEQQALSHKVWSRDARKPKVDTRQFERVRPSRRTWRRHQRHRSRKTLTTMPATCRTCIPLASGFESRLPKMVPRMFVWLAAAPSLRKRSTSDRVNRIVETRNLTRINEDVETIRAGGCLGWHLHCQALRKRFRTSPSTSTRVTTTMLFKTAAGPRAGAKTARVSDMVLAAGTVTEMGLNQMTALPKLKRWVLVAVLTGTSVRGRAIGMMSVTCV